LTFVLHDMEEGNLITIFACEPNRNAIASAARVLRDIRINVDAPIPFRRGVEAKRAILNRSKEHFDGAMMDKFLVAPRAL
jgi:hypothetical protein